jgi:hypothetical protein
VTPSQYISLADSGNAKPTNNTKSLNTFNERFVKQSHYSTINIKRCHVFEKVQSLLTLFVDQVCTFTPLKLIVQEDTQILIFLYNLYVLTSPALLPTMLNLLPTETTGCGVSWVSYKIFGWV